eukprot:426849_1
MNIIKNFHLDPKTFEEYCINNDISRHIPGELDKKFEMITQIELPKEIRRVVSLTITRHWKQLNDNERNIITQGTVFLLQNNLVESADIILTNVIGQENPFDNANDVAIINYLVSQIGKGYIEILSTLHLDPKTFEEYCINNDISRHIPGELDKKFEMITQIE